jgi:hypothetical protein
MRVDITVDGTKADGLPWDGVRDAPDVALCITAESQTTCFPNGRSETEVHRPQCQDSNICRFADVVLPEGARLTVIDVDVISNDVVGVGFCAPNTLCRIGAAQVVITPVRSDVAVPTSTPPDDTFTAMTAAQHLAAARVAMASDYDPRTRTGGDLETATRHVQAVPASAREFRQLAPIALEIGARRSRAQRMNERLTVAAARRMREEMAQTLDRRFIDRGIEVDSVRVTGTDGTIMHINYALCGRVFVNNVAQSDGDTLRGAGFRRVECGSYFESAWVDL